MRQSGFGRLISLWFAASLSGSQLLNKLLFFLVERVEDATRVLTTIVVVAIHRSRDNRLRLLRFFISLNELRLSEISISLRLRAIVELLMVESRASSL